MTIISDIIHTECNSGGARKYRAGKCFMCRKKFAYTAEHAYKRPKSKGNYGYFCSYSCMRAYDKAMTLTLAKRKEEEREHRVTAQRKWRNEKREREDASHAANDA